MSYCKSISNKKTIKITLNHENMPSNHSHKKRKIVWKLGLFPIVFCIKFSNITAEGSVYLSRENLEELHELLDGGFLNDDEDFNRELKSATTAKENVEGKKVYVCEICAKECVSSRGLKRHETLKHTREGKSKAEAKTKENCFINFTDQSV